MGQTQTVTRIRRKKGSVPKGFHPCASCKGTGIKRNVGRGARK